MRNSHAWAVRATGLGAVVLVATACLAASENAVPSRASFDVPSEIKKLAFEVEQLLAAISRRDETRVLAFFSEAGTTIDFHQHVSRQEVREQFRLRRGFVYATLFDTAQLREDGGASEETQNWFSIFDLLQQRGGSVKVRIEDRPPVSGGSAERIPLWARAIIDWGPVQPVRVYSPSFIRRREGWTFLEFFTSP